MFNQYLVRYRLLELLEIDRLELTIKNRDYGASWRKRGGIGAFMMLARKHDRIMNIHESTGIKQFNDLWGSNPADIRDDIIDLRRYLILVEGYRMFNQQNDIGITTTDQDNNNILKFLEDHRKGILNHLQFLNDMGIYEKKPYFMSISHYRIMWEEYELSVQRNAINAYDCFDQSVISAYPIYRHLCWVQVLSTLLLKGQGA